MICPWLVKSIIETNNRNSYNDSRRVEHQEFEKCVKEDCPFYTTKGEQPCRRALAEYADKIALE